MNYQEPKIELIFIEEDAIRTSYFTEDDFDDFME